LIKQKQLKQEQVLVLMCGQYMHWCV